MSARPGDLLVTIRRSHGFYWKPRVYRHISGGLACHWLGLWGMVHNVDADRANAVTALRLAAERTPEQRDRLHALVLAAVETSSNCLKDS